MAVRGFLDFLEDMVRDQCCKCARAVGIQEEKVAAAAVCKRGWLWRGWPTRKSKLFGGWMNLETFFMRI
jgi:hypothetical protein